MDVLFTGRQFKKINCVKEHCHNFYEIIITTEGDSRLFINQKEYFVKKNSVAVIPPNTPHSNVSAAGFKDLFIHVNYVSFVKNKPLVFYDKTGTVGFLGKSLYSVWIQKDFNYQAIVSALLSAINEYIIKFNGASYKYSFVQELKETIAKEFINYEFDLSKIMNNFGVSKHYLRHCFKEETGKTPLEFLTDLRIKQAKLFLAQNRYMTIEEISVNCGFNDPYYFSRCFKKNTGISPREFKQKN